MSTWKHRLSDIDHENRTATCAACGPVKVYRRERRGRVELTCQIAKRERRSGDKRTKEQRLRARLLHYYGLTLEEWHAMLISQSGRCALCCDPMKDPHTDHDHETGAVRGLLCSGCNTALGRLGDSIEGLERAIAYLRSEN